MGIGPSFYSLAATLVAHTGPPPGPASLWSSWSVEPAVGVPILVAAALYARGVGAVWAAAGRVRVVSRAQVACFAGGLTAVAIALLSPLDTLASALFAAHMAQHLLLTVVAAPLLVVGCRRVAMARALPPALRRVVGRAERRVLGAHVRRARLGLVLVAVAVFTATFWVWHTPALYEAAVDGAWVHAVEHVTMLGAAAGLWWAVLAAARRGAPLVGVVALFAATAQGVALAAIVTLAPEPWYGSHAHTSAAWGMTAMADQQVAGALMWTAGGLAYLTGISLLLHRRLDTVGTGRASVGGDSRPDWGRRGP